MPSRMIDYDALWTSERLKRRKESLRHEYLWFYGLADANGCFELNIDSIRSRVSTLRPKLSSTRIDRILKEFHDHGLLFTWISNGKAFGFWTNSDRPGRLPKKSERHRYKRFAPDVPIEGLAEYESRYSRDSLARLSRTGVGVGVGVGLDWIGDGKGVGKSAPSAQGVGAQESAPIASALAPDSSRGTPAQTAGASPVPFRDKNSKPQRTPGRYFCDLCQNEFDDASGFSTHPCSAKTRGGWECIICKATFETITGLRSHRRNTKNHGELTPVAAILASR